MKDNKVCLQGTFYKAQTLIDGGWRVSFDIQSDLSTEIVELSTLHGLPLHVVVMVDGGKTIQDDSMDLGDIGI